MRPNPIDTKISDEAIDWFSKLNSGLASSEDYERFEAWRQQSPLHAKTYANVEKFWAALDEPARRVYQQKNPLSRSKYAGSAATRPSRRWLRGGLALAAAWAMVFWLPGVLHFWSADYRTQWGERKEIVLADHSLVTLNTHSAVSVDFSPKQRKVSLMEGEAYFQVARDRERPFIVKTAYGIVKVTGTAFNIYVQDKRMTVTVSEGRVRVSSTDAPNEEIALTVGQQVVGDENGIGRIIETNTPSLPTWRENLLVFTMQPLAEVVDELNRYFPGRIMIADPRIRQRIVSGAFDLTRPQEAVQAIEKTLGLASLTVSDTLMLLYYPKL
jgi:transmembrane sensor